MGVAMLSWCIVILVGLRLKASVGFPPLTLVEI